MRLRKAIGNFLALQRVGRLSTQRRAGGTHTVPLCHVFDGINILAATDPASQKARNLSGNPKATYIVDEYQEDWSALRGVMLECHVKLLSRGRQFTRARDLLYSKYPQYPDEIVLKEGDAVILKMKPEKVVTWGFESKNPS